MIQSILLYYLTLISMLETLTKKQELLMKKVSNKWIKNFYSWKKINKSKVTRWINMMYKSCGYKNPEIIYLSSPLWLQIGANILRANVKANVGANVKANVGANVWANVWANVEANVEANVGANVKDNVEANVKDDVEDNVGANVWANVEANVKDDVVANVKDDVVANVGANAWANVEANVKDDVVANVGANVWANVEANVKDNVEDKKMDFFDFCNYGDFYDSSWAAFYSYFQEIWLKLWKAEKEFNIFKDMIYWGVYNMIQFEKLCLVSELPINCFKDERKRLHNTKWPAIEWRDWYKLYYINWIHLEEEIFYKIVKDELTVEELLAIENNDTRAIAYEYFGKEKFKNEPHKILDSQIDWKGNEMKIVDFENEKIWRYYVWICPTTKKTHYLATTMNTCKKAKARSFGLDNIIFDNEF